MAAYDMIIRNGTIVDGTGRLPAYRGDVAIKQGKIAMISGRIRASAPQELDATGCIIAVFEWRPDGAVTGTWESGHAAAPATGR